MMSKARKRRWKVTLKVPVSNNVVHVRKLSPWYVFSTGDELMQGQRCANLRCPVRFHKHCAGNFFSDRNTSCPLCKTAWKDHFFVGEQARSNNSRRRISNGGQRQQKSPSPEELHSPPS